MFTVCHSDCGTHSKHPSILKLQTKSRVQMLKERWNRKITDNTHQTSHRKQSQSIVKLKGKGLVNTVSNNWKDKKCQRKTVPSWLQQDDHDDNSDDNNNNNNNSHRNYNNIRGLISISEISKAESQNNLSNHSNDRHDAPKRKVILLPGAANQNTDDDSNELNDRYEPKQALPSKQSRICINQSVSSCDSSENDDDNLQIVQQQFMATVDDEPLNDRHSPLQTLNVADFRKEQQKEEEHQQKSEKHEKMKKTKKSKKSKEKQKEKKSGNNNNNNNNICVEGKPRMAVRKRSCNCHAHHDDHSKTSKKKTKGKCKNNEKKRNKKNKKHKKSKKGKNNNNDDTMEGEHRPMPTWLASDGKSSTKSGRNQKVRFKARVASEYIMD